jgi:hypothetical protein
MTNIKIQIDPEDLDKKTTDKYKNFKQIDRQVNKFYTLSGIRNLYKKNRLLFVSLFLLWLITFVWLVTDLFND